MTTYYIIGRGFAGWHATGVDVIAGHASRCSSSGGSLDPYKYWTGKDCLGYRQQAVDGALVYDASHLEGTPAEKAFIHLIFSGPMVEPQLANNEIEHFTIGEPSRCETVDPNDELTFGFDGARIRALDSVGVGVYEKLLRQIPGIRLGKIYDSKVIWE